MKIIRKIGETEKGKRNRKYGMKESTSEKRRKERRKKLTLGCKTHYRYNTGIWKVAEIEKTRRRMCIKDNWMPFNPQSIKSISY